MSSRCSPLKKMTNVWRGVACSGRDVSNNCQEERTHQRLDRARGGKREEEQACYLQQLIARQARVLERAEPAIVKLEGGHLRAGTFVSDGRKGGGKKRAQRTPNRSKTSLLSPEPLLFTWMMYLMSGSSEARKPMPSTPCHAPSALLVETCGARNAHGLVQCAQGVQSGAGRTSYSL